MDDRARRQGPEAPDRRPESLERELLQAHRLLEGIAGRTDDLIAAQDRQFRYTYFNDAYAREFKALWGHDLAVGDSMVERMAPWPEEQRKARELWQRALDGESFRIEMDFGPTPAETLTYDLRFSPLFDEEGTVVGAAHILRDVTERVRAERELREAGRRKDEFLATLSHELRNPLSAIQHATAILRSRADDPARVIQASETLERQTSQMARLVDGLLELSRVTTGKIRLEIENLELGLLVEKVLEDHRGRCEGSAPTVDATGLEGGVRVEGDPVRLAQIVDNLLTNALKFTPSAGTITLSLDVEGEDAVLSVRDTGVGIDPARLELIFDPFHQESDGAVGGLGLGLSLARSLARLHRGSLTAESAGRGQGARFELRLPLQPNPTDAPPTPPSDREASGLRVLVVEDYADAAEMLVLLLESRGHRASAVATGAEALDFLEGTPVDAVISDIGLPDLSGHELARRIRGEPRWDGILLIAVTGYGQEQDRERAVAAGFDGHLTKPAAIEDIEGLFARLASTSDGG